MVSLILIIFALTLPCLSADGLAGGGGWKKWEDWEGYPIDPFVSDEKWSVGSDCSDENIADISIADYNGSNQLLFSYNGETPDDSCYVYFNDCPERIVGIKADVTVASCGGNQDCRGRVAWHRGTTPEKHYYVWEAVQVRPNVNENNEGFIETVVVKLDQFVDWDWLGDAYSAQFEVWLNPIGETYTVSAIFDKPDQQIVTVEGQGTSTFDVEDGLGSPYEIFKALGMRVQNGTDWNGSTRSTSEEFEVYFDNIYVKTKGSCDNEGPTVKKVEPKKNVNLNECWLDVTFSEPMKGCCWHFESLDQVAWLLSPGSEFEWSPDMQTFSIKRDNCGIALPPKTKLEFIVNPNGTGFIDLKDNPAKTKKVIVKTAKQ